jgi:hypothetical protein
MKKFLTIAATASVLSAFAGSAQANPVNFNGSVSSSCTIDTASTANGTLVASPTTGPATSLSATGSNAGSVKVICNAGSNKLDIAVNTGSSVLYNGTASTAFDSAGGTGIYTSATTGVSYTATGVTSASGDTAKISASVTPTTVGALLQASTAAAPYKVVVDATVTAL